MTVLTTTIKTLLCLMFVGTSRQETPQYSYECKENGDLVLHGFSLHSFIQLKSVNNITFGTDENCTTGTYSSDKYGHISIPKECINGTNITVDRTVVFRADDSVIDGTTRPPTTTAPIPAPIPQTGTGTTSAPGTGTTSAPGTVTIKPSASGAGTTSAQGTTSAPRTVTVKPSAISAANGTGKNGDVTLSYGQRYHYFRIECKVIPEGVVDHVIGHVGVKNVALLPNVFNSIGTVEMRFKSEEATKEIILNDLPDISTVYLGDKFYMYLKYIGEQEYSISPQKCTAYGDSERAVVEKDIRTKKVELWNYTDCVSPDSKSFHLMHTFKKSTDRIMYAEMFGFHFDFDADITIECDVKVCTKSSPSTCRFDASACSGDDKDWKIVKRSTKEEEDNRVTVKSKLHVLERQMGNSNSAGLLHFKWTCLVILQIMLYLY